MKWKPIILGVVIGSILGIAGTFFTLGQRIVRLEVQIEQLQKSQNEKGETINNKVNVYNKVNVSISSITDKKGNVVDRKNAPFVVRVKGTVTGAKGKYLYLVVDDGHEWIEPGLGLIIGDSFSAECFLGEEKTAKSIGKIYKIFSVVTNENHEEFEHLKRETVIKKSEVIELLRTH